MSADLPAPLGSKPALPPGAVARDVERHRRGTVEHVRDAVAEEIPIAFIYNARPHAVMMASPSNFEDFALGFSLSEAIIDDAAQFERVLVVETLAGIELHVSVPEAKAARLEDRVRELTGRTGCGLCGAQTLDAAVRHPPPVQRVPQVDEAALAAALAALRDAQPVSRATGAVHAAAWASLDGALRLVREDVGRHNALDKLIGAMLAQGVDPADGFLVVTSRASFEMIMKAATVGIGFVAAISAPTALAIALAREAQVTLVAFARAEGFSVYTHAQRVRAAMPAAHPRAGARQEFAESPTPP